MSLVWWVVLGGRDGWLRCGDFVGGLEVDNFDESQLDMFIISSRFSLVKI
jgi:hypothetical protein